jgi:hypothetical protein
LKEDDARLILVCVIKNSKRQSIRAACLPKEAALIEA